MIGFFSWKLNLLNLHIIERGKIMGKKLYRSKTNKVIAGVCGGIAEYFTIDPTIIRIIFVVLGFTIAPVMILAYIIAIIIVPEGYGDSFNSFNSQDTFSQSDSAFNDPSNNWKEPAKFDSSKSGLIIGAVLVLLGIMFFVRQFFNWFDMKYFMPLLLIAIGGMIIFKGRRGSY
jgi:phage shock protein C